ncbi:unnamed protein product, partial [Pocillopora meandrina]
MHDISHHIENLLTELPAHIEDESCRKKLEEAVGLATGKKETRRAVDYRCSLITISCYIQIPRLILHFHNSSWYHHTLCQEIFVITTLEIECVKRKLFLYFHAPRISQVMRRSSNAEEEEITFNTVKSITNNTSCYRPGHIISNIFIRLQAEKKLGRSENCVEKQESQVSRLAHSLPLQSNTRTPKELIKKHSRSWQAHLERISDFLLPGEGVWGCQDD